MVKASLGLGALGGVAETVSGGTITPVAAAAIATGALGVTAAGGFAIVHAERFTRANAMLAEAHGGDGWSPGNPESGGTAKTGAPGAESRGSTSNLEKGTTAPRDLREQLAVEQVLSDPHAGVQLELPMNDSRWPASEGWVKMQQIVNPGPEQNVHYKFNLKTGVVDDAKIRLVIRRGR